MQAVVVARPILQQQRRRARLSGLVAALEIFRVRLGITCVDPHRRVPAIGDLGERRIKRGAQRRDRIRQRIREILVFAAAEAVPRHDHPAAKRRIGRVQRRHRRAFLARITAVP